MAAPGCHATSAVSTMLSSPAKHPVRASAWARQRSRTRTRGASAQGASRATSASEAAQVPARAPCLPSEAAAATSARHSSPDTTPATKCRGMRGDGADAPEQISSPCCARRGASAAAAAARARASHGRKRDECAAAGRRPRRATRLSRRAWSHTARAPSAAPAFASQRVHSAPAARVVACGVYSDERLQPICQKKGPAGLCILEAFQSISCAARAGGPAAVVSDVAARVGARATRIETTMAANDRRDRDGAFIGTKKCCILVCTTPLSC